MIENLKNWWMNKWTDGVTDFWHVDTDSQKLKADQNFLGGHGQRRVWQDLSWALKLTQLSQEWTDGINWFFTSWHKFRKAKIWFNNFWLSIDKNGHGFSVQETVNFAAS